MHAKPSFAVIALTFLLFASACSKSGIGKYHPDEPKITVDSTPLLSLSSNWKKATALMNNFPTGIQLYLSKTPVNGKTTVAYCLVFDPKFNIELKPVLASANKKVTDFYNEESGTKYACINGGFFGTNASYSLSMYNGQIDAINIKSLSRPYNGTNTSYYPTRGAFGISQSNQPGVAWIYHVGTGNGMLYNYPQPAANLLNTAPLAVPSATFPAGASLWNVKTAIGGSPVLIKNNVIRISDNEELIAVDNTSSRARSAIGYTSSNKIVILAVEGNNSNGGTGLTLAELAQMMEEIGCIEALNLDGGGSTTLTVNGQQTVKPSDGTERGVMTALIIKAL
ncbi:hypothetical protein DBR11_03670 [Pedobacter sp. HMWF019]|nr:hypothetical protein DBR11_03670 [Pedobacter sp. HMWF019]